TQDWPHSVRLPEQPEAQAFPSHTSPPLHFVVQFPQRNGSLVVASQPLVLSQSWKSGWQPQVPALQVLCSPQSLLQLPQLLGAPSEASQPFSGDPSQSSEAGAQLHRPPSHSLRRTHCV